MLPIWAKTNLLIRPTHPMNKPAFGATLISRNTSVTFSRTKPFWGVRLPLSKMAFLVPDKTYLYALLTFEYFCLTVRGGQVISQVIFILKKICRIKLAKGLEENFQKMSEIVKNCQKLSNKVFEIKLTKGWEWKGS